MSIQFGVKLAAFFTLMGAFSSFSAGQQTTPPANSDTPAQTQTQDTTTGKPAAAQQPAPSADQSKDKAKDKDKDGEEEDSLMTRTS